jgi:hypothetical protein
MVAKNCVTQTRMWLKWCDDKGGYYISLEGGEGRGGIRYCIRDGIRI